MTPREALADAWLSELWPVCREVSREERAAQRARDELELERESREPEGREAS